MKFISTVLIFISFFFIPPLYGETLSNTTNIDVGFLSARNLDREAVRQFVKLANGINTQRQIIATLYKTRGFFVRFFKGKNFKGKTQDAGIILAKDNLVFIVFRGEESEKDMRPDIDSLNTNALRLGMPGKAHKGFMSALLSVWQQIKSPIVSYANSHLINPKNLEYIVIGHGVGGAVASLAALRINDDSSLVMYPRNNIRKNQVKLITFGAPSVLVGNAARLARSIMGARNVLRFVFEGDVIAETPSKGNFSHFGTLVKMKRPSVAKKIKKGGYALDIHKSSAYVRAVPSAFASKF